MLLTFFIQYHTGHKTGKQGNLGVQRGNVELKKQAQSSAWLPVVAAIPNACNVLPQIPQRTAPSTP